jgi:hypothetical protein
MADISTRFDNALIEPSPSVALLTLAEALKSEGMSQQEMYRLFNEHRARHEHDKDETCYNAILDVMDFIVGWCSPHSRLFDSELRT